MNNSLNRFIYNLKGIGRMLTPSFLLPKNREKILRDLDSRKDLDYIKKRVDYYFATCAGKIFLLHRTD